MNEQLLYDLGDVIMTISMIGAVFFAISYAAFFNWRKTAAGKSLMYFVIALVLWAGLSTFTRLIGGEYPGREWIRLAVYITIAAGIWRLAITLWRSWRRTPQNIEPRSKEKP
jgi:hypothetical protein